MKQKTIQQYLDELQIFGLISKRTEDDFADVPNVQSLDEPYITHTALAEKKDEEETNEQPEEVPEETQNIPDEQVPADPGMDQSDPSAMTGEDPNAAVPPGVDPNAMMPGTDPNMMGEEPPKDPNEIGRIYELKKIYNRLLSIESFLSNSSEIELLKLRKYVSQAIELFEILSSNMLSYVEKMDDIIIMFYKFLEVVYAIMTKFYNSKEKEDEKEDQDFGHRNLDDYLDNMNKNIRA